MSESNRWFPLVGAALLLFSACDTNRSAQATAAPAAERSADEQAEVQAIRDASAQWTEGGRAGNAAQMASIYAEDAVTYEAGRDPLRGRTAIRDDYAAAVQAGIQEIDAQIIDVEVAASGDLAYEMGSFTMAVGGAPAERGHYLAVYRKIDGRWQIVREFAQSEARAAQPAARPGS
jgi:uncharacterized protein (TIGR02246 family)